MPTHKLCSAELQPSADRAARAAMLKSRYSDLIRKAKGEKKPLQGMVMIDDQVQRHKELRREFSALCGSKRIPSLPVQGSSSLENFDLRLRTYTYDDIEALHLDDADGDIEVG
ncbi:hypothetical protein COLO4_07154 [Corchorus olitorius]|uniref:Uncharacterized protein n=1 Tax=Corchorus olitorius TaxID=93759 RepID=A0A1R3KKP6_9ROSI|nr:hypothetical protein COLO4_07154 [Corchorus olitorius]